MVPMLVLVLPVRMVDIRQVNGDWWTISIHQQNREPGCQLTVWIESNRNHGGGRRSPAVACWASDHWVASSNPLRGKFRH